MRIPRFKNFSHCYFLPRRSILSTRDSWGLCTRQLVQMMMFQPTTVSSNFLQSVETVEHRLKKHDPVLQLHTGNDCEGKPRSHTHTHRHTLLGPKKHLTLCSILADSIKYDSRPWRRERIGIRALLLTCWMERWKRETAKNINLILFFMVDLCQCAVGNKRSVDLAFSLDTYCVCAGVHGSIRSKIPSHWWLTRSKYDTVV